MCNAFKRKAPSSYISGGPQEHWYRKTEREIQADKLGRHESVGCCLSSPVKVNAMGLEGEPKALKGRTSGLLEGC